MTPPSEGTQDVSRPLRERIAAGQFHTTRWTQVVVAKESSMEGRDALRDLCAAYYSPVMAFLRKQGRDADAAQELAHEFFARMLEGGTIRTASPVEGRFRSYLLGAVKHFLSHRHEAAQRLRRGSGIAPVSIDEPAPDGGEGLTLVDADGLSPDAAFDKQWALTVIDRALDALRQESHAQGHHLLFERVQPWLTGEAEHGDQADLAAALDMNLNSLKSVIHRLKSRFRVLVREEIGATLEDPAVIQEEMRVLFTALKGR